MTSYTLQASKLLENLKEIRVRVESEIHKQQQGQPSMVRGGQGVMILDQISVMMQQIETSTLPPPGQRVRGMGNTVIDSWPMDSELGALILSAEQAYLKLKS